MSCAMNTASTLTNSADFGSETNMSKEDKLSEQYGYWGEHPDYPSSDWQTEVDENATRQGYWEWVAEQISQNDDFL